MSAQVMIFDGADPKVAAKILGAYTGPWCPDCGKRGKKCRNREACRRRAITSFKTMKYVSLPKPSDEWMEGKGYGVVSDRYRNGSTGRPRLLCYLSEAQLRDAHQQYAYELEMGIA